VLLMMIWWLRGQLVAQAATITVLRGQRDEAYAHARELLAGRDAARDQVADLRVLVTTLQRILFGRRCERDRPDDRPAGPAADPGGTSADGGGSGENAAPADAAGDGASSGADPAAAGGGRVTGRRGPGARAGRRDYDDLPRDEAVHDVPGGVCACGRCGRLYTPHGEYVSEHLEWIVRVVVRRVRRRRYRRTCHCDAPLTRTAPGEPKAIGRGLLSNRSLALLLVERYAAGRSLRSLVTGLARHGADLSASTMTGLCAQAGDLLAPLAAQIVERNRASQHLHADETTWRVFTPEPDQGTGSARWWLWVFIGTDTVCFGTDTVCFVADPTRSSAVLDRHLGVDPATGQLTRPDGREGPRRVVLSTDFYAVYVSAGQRLDGVTNLYCVAHLRRHFIRAGDANPAQLGIWLRDWLNRFRALSTAHRQLATAYRASLGTPGPATHAALAAASTGWDTAIDAIDTARRAQQAMPGLQTPAQKALATLDREWDGLAAHRDHPLVDLDNNVSERALRRPVVTRKNAYGSGTGKDADRAAKIWTVLATADLHRLNPLTYLTAYLDACGRGGGKPPTGPDLERFLPWLASPDDLTAWKQPPR
jgi:transposase